MNKVDLVVLGFLMRQPMHGYQIGEFFEKRGIEFWVKIKMPSVYKALNRLESKGQITGEVEIDDCNRARKVYSITDQGKEYFRELLDEIFFTENFVSPFDFWNAFRFLTGIVSRDYFRRLIKHRLTNMENHHKKMEEKRKIKSSNKEIGEIPFYLKMLMEFMHKMGSEEKQLLSDMLKASEKEENSGVFIDYKE